MSRTIEAIERRRREEKEAERRRDKQRMQEEAEARKKEVEWQRLEAQERKRAETERKQRIDFFTQLAHESDVLREINAIRRHELSGVRNELAMDMEKGRIVFVWGSRFTLEGILVEPVYEMSIPSLRKDILNIDCSWIEVELHPDKSISIWGYNLSGLSSIAMEQWKNNPEAVPEALAEAFINPRREQRRGRVPTKSPPTYSEPEKCCS
jgi:hypothetical protein